MNEDLAEAIVLGHDLGHSHFGHASEQALKVFIELGSSHLFKNHLSIISWTQRLVKDKNKKEKGILCGRCKLEIRLKAFGRKPKWAQH